MNLGKVIGTVVSTKKDAKLEGLKLLLVEPTDPTGKPKGSWVVAADSVGAGKGELVLYCSGSSARQTESTQGKPVDAVVMAIVDEVEAGGEVTYRK